MCSIYDLTMNFLGVNVKMSNVKGNDMQFETSKGEIVKGKELEQALDKVAFFYEDAARAIYRKDLYASHVTQKTKDENLFRRLKEAQLIREGKKMMIFAVTQRLNYELTGESVPFMSHVMKKGGREAP